MSVMLDIYNVCPLSTVMIWPVIDSCSKVEQMILAISSGVAMCCSNT